MSNVDPVEEMVRMIEISKSYNSYQKVIQSMDEASKKLINELGRF
jgi:flagellar basal-body rod protein FlgG